MNFCWHWNRRGKLREAAAVAAAAIAAVAAAAAAAIAAAAAAAVLGKKAEPAAAAALNKKAEQKSKVKKENLTWVTFQSHFLAHVGGSKLESHEKDV